jgi:hypothetical protein
VREREPASLSLRWALAGLSLSMLLSSLGTFGVATALISVAFAIVTACNRDDPSA